MASGTITILPTDIIKPVEQKWEYAKRYEPMFVGIPYQPKQKKQSHKKFVIDNLHFSKQEIRRIVKVLFHVNNLPLNEWEFKLEYSDNLWAAVNRTLSEVKFFLVKGDPVDNRLTVHLIFDTSLFKIDASERVIKVLLQKEKNPSAE